MNCPHYEVKEYFEHSEHDGGLFHRLVEVCFHCGWSEPVDEEWTRCRCYDCRCKDHCRC